MYPPKNRCLFVLLSLPSTIKLFELISTRKSSDICSVNDERHHILNLKFDTIMSNNGNTLLAIIAGSAIGAALGILYAPDKGEVTRKRIADKANETKESLTENAIQLKHRVADTIASEKETLDTRVESLVSDVSYKTEDIISTLEKKLSELKAKNKKLQKSS